MGLVTINSKVPSSFSSAKERMVMAGINKRYNQGAITNKGSKLAKPEFKMLLLLPLSGMIKRNKPVATKKVHIMMYPMSEPKKLFISFENKANMG